MTKFAKDLLAGAVVLAIGVFMYAGSLDIKIMKLSSGSVSSAFMPRLCAVLLILLGLGIAATNLMVYALGRKAATAAPGKTGGAMSREAKIRLAAIVGLLFLYCLFFNKLGFIASSALYLFSSVLVLAPPSQRKTAPSVIIGVVVPLAIYYIFANVFHMLLPGGVLG